MRLLLNPQPQRNGYPNFMGAVFFAVIFAREVCCDFGGGAGGRICGGAAAEKTKITRARGGRGHAGGARANGPKKVE